jgi:hypothetical protein
MARTARSVAASIVAVAALSMSSTVVATDEQPASAPPPEVVVGLMTCHTTHDLRGSVEEIQLERSGFLSRKRGWGYQQDVTFSDSRLQGDHLISVDWDEYAVPGELRGLWLGTYTWRVENDGGAWQGSYADMRLGDDDWADPLIILAGEGDYEGLNAILTMQPNEEECGEEIRGLIVADAMLAAAPPPFVLP